MGVSIVIAPILAFLLQFSAPGGPVVEPGWPVSQPAYAFMLDMDGDGTREVLLRGAIGPDEFGINVYAADGTVITPSFQHNGQVILPFGEMRVGDIDGDGMLDVVFPTIDAGFNDLVYAFDHLGNVLPGWPIAMRTVEYILADLTGDGTMEVVCQHAGFSVCQNIISAFEGNGTLMEGWPVNLCHDGEAYPHALGAGDVDFDGTWEVVTSLRVPGLNSPVYLVDGHGEVVPGWPRELPADVPRRYAIGDIDGDFKCEIVGVSFFTVYFLKANGDVFLPPEEFGSPREIAMGDVTNDGTLDFVIAGRENLWIWDGSVQSRTTVVNLTTPAPHEIYGLNLADFDGDGDNDIMVASWWRTAGTTIEFFDGTGQSMLAPIVHPISSRPQFHFVGQLDDDAELELTNSELTPSVGIVHMWEIPTSGPIAPTVAWGMRGHDPTGAGFYHHGNYPERRFVRGDLNRDNVVDISDVIATGRMLFLGAEYSCPAASDFNDDANHNILDMVGLVYYLYANGPAPSAPFPQCEGNNGARFPCQNFVCP